ncbi:MAG: translation elongation factor-like protein [Deltaproteobacteria bacterium]|jgi:putative protease|nr:translation elongation factor-like protein [Deltaproteobacteria bacterium]MBW1736416.1 translation elongation factor-like protein [Deltaproteobacteria bacterium]MBW1907951.1 translation elongation factor-like protein [Deltaproteobacteria bacterium]MBW2033224.1 translation elongation factor-like protein [Deltaproteobacteria bacterium]MBW2113711.1 translation elongation factor-like protein [Deltaproteobacteria bacterium]
MPEEQVAVIVKFFAKPSVAALEVTNGIIKIGDVLKYKGHTTDFTEEITSMEIDNQAVVEAKVGDLIGVKVKERVRENDKVYKVVE